MSRDDQRAKVYGAEQQVRRILDRTGAAGRSLIIHGSTITLEDERRFGTIEAVRTYVEYVQRQPWYRERYPTATPLQVRHRKGSQFAHYERGIIAVHDSEARGAAWAMRELVVLHEMAHHVSRRGASHGPVFVREFIEHVRQQIGEGAAFVLRDAMYGAEVRIAS